MGEFFRDAIWQFVGAVLSVAAIVSTIWIYRRQRSTKLLAYSNYLTVPLFEVKKIVADHFKVFYADKEVTSAHFVYFSFQNQGTSPIARQDYDCPISVRVTLDGQVTSAFVMDESPADLNVVCAVVDERAIRIDPVLLNAGDRFKIAATVVNGTIDAKVAARIIGGQVIANTELDNGFANKLRTWPADKIISAIIAGIFVATVSGLLGKILADLAIPPP